LSIPDKLKNFKCYDDAEDMVGIADVALPDLAFITEAMQGAGIAGPIDTPVAGHFQSLTTTVNWRSLVKENIRFVAPKAYHFDFRGSVQIYDEDSGSFTESGLKVVMRCIPKNLNLGNLNVATQMGTSGVFEVIYVHISIDGEEMVEIDKLAFICRINGVDYLTKTRQNLGLA